MHVLCVWMCEAVHRRGSGWRCVRGNNVDVPLQLPFIRDEVLQAGREDSVPASSFLHEPFPEYAGTASSAMKAGRRAGL